MMSERVFQRANWDGTPREMADWFTLKKGQRRAVCRMFTHVFGHELRLEVSRELVASEVCRTDEEIMGCVERWRTGLRGEGLEKMRDEALRLAICDGGGSTGRSVTWLTRARLRP